MTSFRKVIFGFLALVFFAIGWANLTSFVWIGEDGGPSTLTGFFINIGSLLIPWVLALGFAAETLKEAKSDDNPPSE